MVSLAADSAGSTAADAASDTVESDSLQLDSIPIVDIRLLSQSELYSLSLCSSSSFDPQRCDDVIIPKIDRSVFNESAGSRKQTYSRLRLAPPSSSPLPVRRRTPHLRPSATLTGNVRQNISDPENAENSYIVNLLKQLFCSGMNPDELVPVKVDYSHSVLPREPSSVPPHCAFIVGHAKHKRKRGRPRKNEMLEKRRGAEAKEARKSKAEGSLVMNEVVMLENAENKDAEFMNKDGVAVDFVALGIVEHPFWEEIRLRTEGLRSEEEILRFLNGLNGRWGSSRKKRRIVDASEFGNALPIGWKLLLSAKKKNGSAWLYCRRYISPSGRQFVTCKDVCSYLLALNGVQVTNFAQHEVSDADNLTSHTTAGQSDMNDNTKDIIAHVGNSEKADTEICLAITNNRPSQSSPFNNDMTPIGDSEKADGDIRVHKVGNFVTEPTPCSVGEVSIFNNENISVREVSDCAHDTCDDAEMIDDSSLQGNSGSGCSLLQFRDETVSVLGSVIKMTASEGMPKQDSVSESHDIVVDNVHTGQTRDEFYLNADNFAMNNSIFDFSKTRGLEKDDGAVNVNQQSNNEVVSCENTDITHNTSNSVSVVSKLNENSSINLLVTNDRKIDPCSTDKLTVDETSCFGACDKDNSATDNNVTSRQEEQQFVLRSVTPYDTEVSTCKAMNPGVQHSSISELVVLPGHENGSYTQNNDDDVCRGKIDILQLDYMQNFGNGELSDPFRGNCSALNSNSLTEMEQCRNLDVFSGFTSSMATLSEENILSSFNSASEGRNQEPFDCFLSGQPRASEIFDEPYRENKIYATPAVFESNGIETYGKHDLNLPYGNPNKELLTDSDRVDNDSYLGNFFATQSSIPKRYGHQTIESTRNNNIPNDLQLSKPPSIEFLDSSFNRRHEHDSSNIDHSKMDWNQTRGEKLETSGQTIMVDFWNDGTHLGESVKTDGSWKTGGHDLQTCFGTSNPQVQPSRHVHPFDVMSDKGEEGSSGVNMSFDTQTEILRRCRTEPVEYSFMGEQNSSSMTEEPKIFSYVDLQHGLDPSFLLGNNNLMPNTRRQVTSICMLCRNLFNHEAIQTGEIGAGSVCPSCSSRIPCQFNVL